MFKNLPKGKQVVLPELKVRISEIMLQMSELQNTSYQMWTLIQNKINQLVSQT